MLFLDYAVEIRRLIRTPDAIESIDARGRSVQVFVSRYQIVRPHRRKSGTPGD
jgi:hypothetical protein